MKKNIALVLIPGLIIVLLLLGFALYSYLTKNKDNEKPADQQVTECRNSSISDLPEDIKNSLSNACITQYNKTGEETVLLADTIHTSYPEIIYALRQSDWGKASIQANETLATFTTEKQILSVSKENGNVRITLKANPQANTQPSEPAKPKPAPSEDSKPSTSYKVTSTEISKISTTQKFVVFTFDGGAGIQSLDKIISTLAKHNLKATFFVTGKWAETQPESLKKISNAGHEVFNHTYSHLDLTKLSSDQIEEELSKAETKISAVTGKTTKPFYRPPYGARNSTVREKAASLGYQTIYWTVDALDWKESEGITEKVVKDRILDNLAPGNIYLMHIGDNITGSILDDVITQIEAKGYKIKTLSQALIK